MQRCGVLLFLFIFCISAYGQKMPLTSFKDSILPKSGAGDLYDITQSPNRFVVSIVRDSLSVVMHNDSTPPHSTSFPLRNGNLIGYNHGEFGGHLVFNSPTGSADTVFDGPVQHIFSCYGMIFFTSGMWHMSQHYGQLFKLDTTNGKFQAKIFSSFEYPIRHCHVTRDTMYLISYGVLYRMQYGKLVTVSTLPFVATSMTSQGRYMYFGMRGGYARYDMKTKQYRYFVYVEQ